MKPEVGPTSSRSPSNLEQVGDIIEKSANDVVSKNIERNHISPTPDWQGYATCTPRLVAKLRLAMNVFINNDINDAEKLLAERGSSASWSWSTMTKHLVRLADHTAEHRNQLAAP